MNETIIGAIISSTAGLVGVFVGVFKDEIIGYFQKSNRKLTGHWSGSAEDIDVPGVIEYDKKELYQLNVRIKQKGRTLKGIANIDTDTRHTTHKVSGKMVSDELAELTYRLEVEGSIHSGRMMLRVNGVADKLEGYFLAKRAYEFGHVFGVIKLKKNV